MRIRSSRLSTTSISIERRKESKLRSIEPASVAFDFQDRTGSIKWYTNWNSGDIIPYHTLLQFNHLQDRIRRQEGKKSMLQDLILRYRY